MTNFNFIPSGQIQRARVRTVNSEQRPRQFQLLRVQQQLTQIHMGYNWPGVHFIYCPSPLLFGLFQLQTKIVGRNL